MLFLLAQPVLIAMLVGWVAEDYVLRMFLCVVATLWFGCSNGAQQIIKELPIFRRERICGLGLNAYLFSKYLFLGVITAFQALLLLIIVQTTSHLVRPAKLTPGELYAEFQSATASKDVVPLSSGEEAEFRSCRSARGWRQAERSCCASRHFKSTNLGSASSVCGRQLGSDGFSNCAGISATPWKPRPSPCRGA